VKLTTRSEYALLALIHLARAEGPTYLSAISIAEAQGLPPKFLEQLLLVLKRGGLVKSQKGQRGGYKLARPAEKICLAEIIRLLDGALAPTDSVSRYFYEPTPVEKEKRLLRVFKEIRDLVSARLERTSLADVR
jgi:Rrf2 family cysteine metabolism transcriptional repressor